MRIHNVKGPWGGGKLPKKGRYFENKARKELEAEGFYVMRSGGSKGLWDLIASRRDKIKFIQVKRNQLPRPKERKRLAKFDCPEIATKEIWVYYGMGQKKIYVYKDVWNIPYEKKQI